MNMQNRFPLKVFLFDLLFLNNQDFTVKPYIERRAKLLEVVHREMDSPIQVTENLITDNSDALHRYFEEMVQRGLEGIVAKKLSAAYHAGARNYNWIRQDKRPEDATTVAEILQLFRLQSVRIQE